MHIEIRLAVHNLGDVSSATQELHCLLPLPCGLRPAGIRALGFHSNDPENQNSNWLGGLTIWDVLHRTLNLGVSQDEAEIGRKGFERPEQVTLPKILTPPFRYEPAVRAFLEAGSTEVLVHRLTPIVPPSKS